DHHAGVRQQLLAGRPVDLPQLGDDLPDEPGDATAKTWLLIPDLNRSVRLDRFPVARAPRRCAGAAVRLGSSRHRSVVGDRVECVVELLVLEVLIHGTLAASVALGHFALFHLYGGWCVAHRALTRPGTAPHDVAGASAAPDTSLVATCPETECLPGQRTHD